MGRAAALQCTLCLDRRGLGEDALTVMVRNGALGLAVVIALVFATGTQAGASIKDPGACGGVRRHCFNAAAVLLTRQAVGRFRGLP